MQVPAKGRTSEGRDSTFWNPRIQSQRQRCRVCCTHVSCRRLHVRKVNAATRIGLHGIVAACEPVGDIARQTCFDGSPFATLLHDYRSPFGQVVGSFFAKCRKSISHRRGTQFISQEPPRSDVPRIPPSVQCNVQVNVCKLQQYHATLFELRHVTFRMQPAARHVCAADSALCHCD